jgi:hypothetical protein
VKFRHPFLTILLAIALLGTACSSAADTLGKILPQSADEIPQNTVEAQTFAVAPASSGDGLEQLNSYRANLIVDFEGIRDGQAVSGQIESLVEVNRSASALHRYLATDGEVSNFIQQGNSVYIAQDGQESYFEVEAGRQLSPGDIGFMDLNKLIILPRTVSVAPQIESVDDLTALHYRFDQHDLTVSEIIFERAQGEAWVATPNNYLVQYVISATIKTAASIPNAHLLDEGTLQLNYKLTDINTEIPMTLPDTADLTPTLFADFPPPPDAKTTAIYPTLIEYTSAISPISATLFYKTGLPTRGWTEDSAELFEEKSRLIFSKDNRRLTILVTPTDDPAQIKITLDVQIEN